MEKICVVEFQSFKGHTGEHIVKELVILDVSTSVINYFLFKPPYSISDLSSKNFRTNNWLTNHYHHISWEEGFTDYNDLERIIKHYCNQYNIVYTSGEEKRKFIQMYTESKVVSKDIVKGITLNLNNMCTSVKDSKHKGANCAIKRAYRLTATILGDVYKSADEYALYPQMYTCVGFIPTVFTVVHGGGTGYINGSQELRGSL